jgi:hypothetical protein
MFVNPKSLYLPGEIFFLLSGDMLEVYACDDYFAVTDTAIVTEHDNTSFVLSLNDVKGYTKNKEHVEGLEEFARRMKKEEIAISTDSSSVTFMADMEALTFQKGTYREENWDIVEGLIYSDEVTPVRIDGFRSNPERYAKLSQLKYDKKKFGIEWKFVETKTGVLLIRFEVGPSLKGVIRPLEESQEGDFV